MNTLYEVPYSLCPGDSHLTLCLNETPKGEFSTHMKNKACGGFHHGSYFMTLPEALKSLSKRMATNYHLADATSTPSLLP